MKKTSIVLMLLFLSILTASAQVRFSANANVYNNQTNQKVGSQYISANIDNGSGTMTLGRVQMKAVITSSRRDNQYQMTAYSVSLCSSSGKIVEAVITKRDNGTYSIVVYYSDGTLRYDF